MLPLLMFAIFRLMKVFNVAYHYADIKAFYNVALHIPDVRYSILITNYKYGFSYSTFLILIHSYLIN